MGKGKFKSENDDRNATDKDMANRSTNERTTSRGKEKRGGRKPKSRKPYDNPRTDVTTGAPFNKFKSGDGMNDVSWYAGNPQMLADSASFSYNAALGSKVGWGCDVRLDPSSVFQGIKFNGTYGDTFPGILSLNYVNYAGLSRDNTSPINIAADNIYSFVRHANSGHANYDEPDIMMYLLAIDSLYSFIAYGRRVYGSARLFNQKNYYYQKALIQMQGFDYDDLIFNLANFRLYLNSLAAKASSFAVPATMPLMQRHFFMASNLYKDSDTEKAQLMLFQPMGFHMYGLFSELPEPYNTAGALGMKPLPAWNLDNTNVHFMTVSEFMTYGNEMLDRLLNSEDIGIISGDILKAFQGKVFTIPTTPDEYVVMPVYQPEVLLQIQNARTIPDDVRARSLHGAWNDGYFHHYDIIQDPNTNNILSDPAYFTPLTALYSTTDSCLPSLLYAFNPIVSCNVDHPTPGDSMVATRLSNAWHVTDATVNGKHQLTWVLDAVGSEIIIEMDIAHIIDGNIKIERPIDQVIGTTNSTPLLQGRLAMITNFDHHPFITVVNPVYTGDREVVFYPMPYIGNMDTYRVMHPDDLTHMNLVAMLSMLGVPTLGTY